MGKTLKEVLESTDDMEIEVAVPEQTEVAEGLCSDCGDQPSEIFCKNCDEPFCEVCFGYIHRAGKRKQHEYVKGESSEKEETVVNADGASSEESEESEEESEEDIYATKESKDAEHELQKTLAELKSNAKFIPMRLTHEERALMRLLNAALEVSEYVDHVDCASLLNKTKRIVTGLREICTVLTGLVVASDLDVGKELLDGREFSEHKDWFQTVFEIGRRYKIMNPERMRSNYGKLVYMIMDSRLPEIKELMEFDLYKPVQTVYMHLEAAGSLEMLDDPLLVTATQEIVGNRPRQQIQKDIKQKERSIEKLAKKYGEKVRQGIYSLSDFHSYIAANRTPVSKMLDRLTSMFSPTSPTSEFSLNIVSGLNSARLTHNHARQYQYVLQSLTLWSEIMGNMYLLWKLADDDLFDERRYNLGYTGQGLNRMKPSPKLAREMHRIISRAQQQTGTWVGSSVVHLGDTAVPNSFFFLDKYLQVPRILNPVNTVLNLLPKIINQDKYSQDWVKQEFESVDRLEKIVLTDFFRHAFDGSGADNFYDAGSCIDGRLTSAWNWANNLSKKPYFKHFLVTGFIGFDGTEGF